MLGCDKCYILQVLSLSLTKYLCFEGVKQEIKDDFKQDMQG